jgi:ribosomal protein S18 acetylase RimI-like enzyme
VEKKYGKQSIRGEDGNNDVTIGVEGNDNDDAYAADAVQIVTDAAGTDIVVPFAPTDGKRSATQPAQLGVKLVWVAPEYRRRGVARDLLDAARKDLIFGSVVALDAIAFSQPTEEGFAFAQGYCGNERVRVYS